jgi:hypothetical protein
MKKLRFDKEKYLAILRAEGLSAALTALHQDTEPLEFETFEGRQGWQPEAWDDLTEIRQFSRELWDLAGSRSTRP